MYNIISHDLGENSERGDVLFQRRDQIDTSRLKQNLDLYWAWNLRGIHGYETDGPAVFINFNKIY